MDRIVLVTKPSRLEELVRRHLTEGAAKFALETRGQPFALYKSEDVAYHAALAIIRAQIPGDIPLVSVSREGLPNFLFRDNDLIIVCGPDGLFVNLAKYVGSQPIVAINPDPTSVAGALMLFSPQVTGRVIASVQTGKHKTEKLPLAKALIDNERTVWGVNDIFVGRKDKISARYALSFEGEEEHQSSDGILISTGTGSTGWIRSIATMIEALIPPGVRHELMDLPQKTADELAFVVQAPFVSPQTQATLVSGRISPEEPLVVVSEMPTGGYVFSDGVVEKALEWNAGSRVEISVGERYVERVIS